MTQKKKGFEYRGVNHVALVCRDMAETTDFYEKVLEMPCVRAGELPGGGQHFFFDCGQGATLGFMWFPGAPPAAPGIASQHLDVRKDGAKTAIGSMNHLAIDVPLERFEEFVQRLRDKGVQVSIINHGDANPSNPTPEGQRWKPDGDTWIRSAYFTDPNGIKMELAACVRDYEVGDLRCGPVNDKGVEVENYAYALQRPLEPAE